MAFLKKIFTSKTKVKTPRGFNLLTILKITRLSEDTVMVSLAIPADLKSTYRFTPGQYLDFAITINGEKHRRSYSICSGENETLAVAVKKIDKGIISTWFNDVANEQTEILTSSPQGNFTIEDNFNTVVSFVAGSGITPVMSIAKKIEATGKSLALFYGNRTQSSILFKPDLDALSKTDTRYYLSGETTDGFGNGRLDSNNISEIIKENLALLKADCFLLCGPEEMILSALDVLKTFGVSEDKIKYELFTTPVKLKTAQAETSSNFEGTSTIVVILDDEKESFQLEADGMSILEKSNKEGLDAPYSCRGGVCSTCKAKVIKGKASMKMNYSLTEDEVEDGYILACQAHPASEELVISFDDV